MGIVPRGRRATPWIRRPSEGSDKPPSRMTAAQPSRQAQRRGRTSPSRSGPPAFHPVDLAESVGRYLPLIRGLARRFRKRSAVVDVEDLVSAGTVGLMEALDRFDPGRGVSLSSFAYHRIRGAILDEMRRQLHPSGRTRGPAPEEVSFDAPLQHGEEPMNLLDVTLRRSRWFTPSSASSSTRSGASRQGSGRCSR